MVCEGRGKKKEKKKEKNNLKKLPFWFIAVRKALLK